jgi:hypothetical protein
MDTCEVSDLESSATTCKKMPNFPAAVFSAIGTLRFEQHPIICGGYQNGLPSNKCYSFKNNEWVSSESMNLSRVNAAAAKWQNGKLLVTGGWNSLVSFNSTEVLTVEGWQSIIPSLPFRISSHCIVTVNSTTVMVIGDDQDGPSGKTFLFTLGEESWIEGPEMKYKRVGHNCGRIRRDKESQEMSIIVTGGKYGPSYSSSVEILDGSSNKWQTGPELPFGMRNSQMVEDSHGGVVLIGGESPYSAFLGTLFQLPHAGQNAVWTQMEQKLKLGRRQHTAFLVPDNIVDCS